jgi:predicted acetyltransferase
LDPSPAEQQTAAVTSFETRPLARADLPVAWQLLEHAFGGANHPADHDVELGLVQEPARFYGTYDGERAVTTGGSYALTMTVPGGSRPVAGVTWVGVDPTYRRRGLLRALMRRQLDDLQAGGEAVAALWASEGAIYQRFGYGPAAWDVSLRVPSKAPFGRPVDTGGLRMGAPDAAALAPIYDAVAGRSLGWTARDGAWWAYRLHDPEHRREGAAPLLAVVDGSEGYALYATKQGWREGRSDGTVAVRELVATNPTSLARLWRYLLDLDLMTQVHLYNAAVDDPLLHLLAEPRAATAGLKDNLWVRLVDVPGALQSRAYAAEVDVVLEVADPFCPWNAGRWRLSGGPAGATCGPTSDAADLVLGVADLGAAYLGGTTLVARAAAGSVTELRPGALGAASTAFGWPGLAPYAPMVF